MATIFDLNEQKREELIARTMHPTDAASRDRRKEFAARDLAMRERPDSLVRERIGETFHTPEIRAEVQRWATGIFNPLRRVSEQVAKVYSEAPLRKINGLGKRATADWHRALRRMMFDVRCKAWNQRQVAMNTLAVLVRPAKRSTGEYTVEFDRVTGANGEVVRNPEAPFDDVPAILAYTIATDGDVYRLRRGQGLNDTEVVCTVDDRFYAYWTAERKLARLVPHELGMFPGALLRSTIPAAEDENSWWDPDFGRSMTQALRESGLAGAIMGWTRKTLFGKLVTVLRSDESGDLTEDDGDEGQPLGHPESVLELTGSELRVEDLRVGVEQFREHMGMMLAEAAHALTGTASILEDPAPGQTTSDTAAVHRHAALRGLQNEQMMYLEPFEHQLHTVVAALGTRIGVRGMPRPEQVRDDFEVRFRPMTFLETPSERINVEIARAKYGVSDPAEFVAQRDGVSIEEAEERVKTIVERQARINKIRTREESPADPTRGATPNQEVRPELPGEGTAAATGRRGGRASPTA